MAPSFPLVRIGSGIQVPSSRILSDRNIEYYNLVANEVVPVIAGPQPAVAAEAPDKSVAAADAPGHAPAADVLAQDNAPAAEPATDIATIEGTEARNEALANLILAVLHSVNLLPTGETPADSKAAVSKMSSLLKGVLGKNNAEVRKEVLDGLWPIIHELLPQFSVRFGNTNTLYRVSSSLESARIFGLNNAIFGPKPASDAISSTVILTALMVLPLTRSDDSVIRLLRAIKEKHVNPSVISLNGDPGPLVTVSFPRKGELQRLALSELLRDESAEKFLTDPDASGRPQVVSDVLGGLAESVAKDLLPVAPIPAKAQPEAPISGERSLGRAESERRHRRDILLAFLRELSPDKQPTTAAALLSQATNYKGPFQALVHTAAKSSSTSELEVSLACANGLSSAAAVAFPVPIDGSGSQALIKLATLLQRPGGPTGCPKTAYVACLSNLLMLNPLDRPPSLNALMGIVDHVNSSDDLSLQEVPNGESIRDEILAHIEIMLESNRAPPPALIFDFARFSGFRIRVFVAGEHTEHGTFRAAVKLLQLKMDNFWKDYLAPGPHPNVEVVVSPDTGCLSVMASGSPESPKYSYLDTETVRKKAFYKAAVSAIQGLSPLNPKKVQFAAPPSGGSNKPKKRKSQLNKSVPAESPATPDHGPSTDALFAVIVSSGSSDAPRADSPPVNTVIRKAFSEEIGGNVLSLATKTTTNSNRATVVCGFPALPTSAQGALRKLLRQDVRIRNVTFHSVTPPGFERLVDRAESRPPVTFSGWTKVTRKPRKKQKSTLKDQLSAAKKALADLQASQSSQAPAPTTPAPAAPANPPMVTSYANALGRASQPMHTATTPQFRVSSPAPPSAAPASAPPSDVSTLFRSVQDVNARIDRLADLLADRLAPPRARLF